MKEMELLDNGRFILLKKENIEIDTLFELINKYTIKTK